MDSQAQFSNECSRTAAAAVVLCGVMARLTSRERGPRLSSSEVQSQSLDLELHADIDM